MTDTITESNITYIGGIAYHNPLQLTPVDWGASDGWRLLTVHERTVLAGERAPSDLEYKEPDLRWLSSVCRIFRQTGREYCYRTRAPLPPGIAPAPAVPAAPPRPTLRPFVIRIGNHIEKVTAVQQYLNHTFPEVRERGVLDLRQTYNEAERLCRNYSDPVALSFSHQPDRTYPEVLYCYYDWYQTSRPFDTFPVLDLTRVDTADVPARLAEFFGGAPAQPQPQPLPPIVPRDVIVNVGMDAQLFDNVLDYMVSLGWLTATRRGYFPSGERATSPGERSEGGVCIHLTASRNQYTTDHVDGYRDGRWYDDDEGYTTPRLHITSMMQLEAYLRGVDPSQLTTTMTPTAPPAPPEPWTADYNELSARVGSMLANMIRVAPARPDVEGHILAKTRLRLPPEAELPRTSDDLCRWVLDNFNNPRRRPVRLTGASATIPTTTMATPAPTNNDVFEFRVYQTETERGRCDYTLSRSGTGTIELTTAELMDLAAQADGDEDVFMDLVNDHLVQTAMEDPVEMETDDSDYDDHDCDSSEIESTEVQNLRRVVQAFLDANPNALNPEEGE